MRRIAQFPRPAAGSQLETATGTGLLVGRIVSFALDGSLGVRAVGLAGEMRARLAVPATEAQIRDAIESGQDVVLGCERGDPARPIILGFIQRPAAASASVAPQEPELTTDEVVQADVDGRRVRIVARDEIVLQCGEASITLRRNGRVVVRGTYVETHSEGTNRIKGGQVRIN